MYDIKYENTHKHPYVGREEISVVTSILKMEH
jgi:hypothetical protein